MDSSLKIKTVGAYEAKTHLPELLDFVSKSKGRREVLITKHKKPVARLVSVDRPSHGGVSGLFCRLDSLRSRLALRKDLTAKNLINAGRRV